MVEAKLALCFVSDLPNYQWNHSVKYWHESESSHDWRFRKFPYHDLLGSKILGSPWTNPTWKYVLRLSDISWLRDHLLGHTHVANQSLPRSLANASDIAPLQHPVSGAVWYKAMRRVGYHFGSAFQPCQQVEAKADSRQCRA
ncbi:hypothetical protein AtubIFM57258_004972 [Aspergillus tubingensis]|nr:hypothetical protein AtubIFM57258_004972 [Aspergillus tubingensis]